MYESGVLVGLVCILCAPAGRRLTQPTDSARIEIPTPPTYIHAQGKLAFSFFALLLLLLRCVLVAALAPFLTERSRTSSSLLADKLPPSPWYLS